MNIKIKPIETRYKGYQFRSRLEARWAVFFDALGVDWEYEPEGFVIGDQYYLPDFRLKCWGTRGSIEEKPFDLYVEVKGVMTEKDAQKIRDFSQLTFREIEMEKMIADHKFFTDEDWILLNEKFPMNPVLIVGNIPDVLSPDDVNDSSIFKSYKPMNGINIYPFNYETIDDDHFAAYPDAFEGKFYLMGDDMNYSGPSELAFRAYQKARAARFEHGEKG